MENSPHIRFLLRRPGACAALWLFAAVLGANVAQAQSPDATPLAREAADVASVISTCLSEPGSSVDHCASISVPRLRQLRARIHLYVSSNPQPGAPWMRDAARLDTAVDGVVQSATKLNLRAATTQLSAIAESLPKTAGPAPVSPTPAPTTSAAPPAPTAPTSSTHIPASRITKEDAGFRLVTAGDIETNDWTSSAPDMKLKFLIERSDHSPFNALTADKIQAIVEGEMVDTPSGKKPREWPITLGPADLVTKSDADSSVVLVLDASGSMSAGSRGESGDRIDKISAAKSAVGDFLDHLKPEDKVAIVVFDAEPRMLFNLSADKVAAHAAVEAFTISQPGALYTALYDAMDYSVKKAKDLGLKNVVFLTDGVEDSPAFRALMDREKDDWKRNRESDIASRARTSGVRIYSIGIGNRDAASLPLKEKDLAFVDCDTLDRISSATHGGSCNYVDMPDLANKANHSAAEYHTALVSRLSGILQDINKAFHYDYTLVIHPDKASLLADGQQHIVRIMCNVDRVLLPVEFPYSWDGKAPPKPGPAKTGKPIFLKAPGKDVPVSNLFGIYLRCLVALLVLALIPQVFRWLAVRREMEAIRGAVLTIPEGSAYIGRECPNERNRLGSEALIKKGDHVIVCPNPDCNTPHHLSCWHENRDRCWVRVTKTGDPCNTPLELTPAVLKAYGIKEKQGASA